MPTIELLDMEKQMIIFMQKMNIFNIPFSDQRYINKGYTNIILGNDEILLERNGNLISFIDCKMHNSLKKESIHKYVLWYCSLNKFVNNMA